MCVQLNTPAAWYWLRSGAEFALHCLVVSYNFAVLAASAEMFDVRPVDVTVAQGQEAMFNCSGSSVGWVRNLASDPQVTMKIFQSPDQWYTQEGRDKFDVSGEYNLIVYNADARADAGKYQCNARESDHLYPAYLVVIGMISFLSVRCPCTALLLLY